MAGPRDIWNALVAAHQAQQIKNRIYTQFAPDLTPGPIAGEKNFNAEHAKLKEIAQTGDAFAAKRYVQGQRAKLKKQQQK